MTSSNAVAEPALAVGSPAEQTPDAATTPAPTAPSPFELLPTGEAFGVCDLDGACS